MASVLSMARIRLTFACRDVSLSQGFTIKNEFFSIEKKLNKQSKSFSIGIGIDWNEKRNDSSARRSFLLQSDIRNTKKIMARNNLFPFIHQTIDY